MLREQIISLINYNHWANTKLTGFLRKLGPQLLDKVIISSFNTLRKTLYHVWDAEIIWFSRLNGKSLSDWPSKSFNGTDEDAFKGFVDQSAKFIALVENMKEEHLLEKFSYKSTEGKPFSNTRAEVLQHVMNHSTFHRGQMITMLRNAGYTNLSSTDYITFIREHNKHNRKAK